MPLCLFRLFVTFNYQMTMIEMKVDAKNRVMSHERPVTCAIYNSLYNQVYIDVVSMKIFPFLAWRTIFSAETKEVRHKTFTVKFFSLFWFLRDLATHQIANQFLLRRWKLRGSLFKSTKTEPASVFEVEKKLPWAMSSCVAIVLYLIVTLQKLNDFFVRWSAPAKLVPSQFGWSIMDRKWSSSQIATKQLKSPRLNWITARQDCLLVGSLLWQRTLEYSCYMIPWW